MPLIEIDTNPPRKQLHVFALCWLVFFGAAGAVVWAGGAARGAAVALWAAAVGVPAVGLLWPAVLRVLYVAMAFATWPIGLAVSFLILAGVYYLVITPTGLLLRLFGRDPMSRRFDREAETYWVPHRQADNIKRYFQQF